MAHFYEIIFYTIIWTLPPLGGGLCRALHPEVLPDPNPSLPRAGRRVYHHLPGLAVETPTVDILGPW